MMLERESNMTNEFFKAPKLEKATIDSPSLLRWRIDEKIYSDMSLAMSRHHQAINNLDFRLLRFKTFGKNALKQYKVSPDAVFQISLQLAYLRLHGKVAATYESASTRQYARGRTETGRSANVDTVAFIKAFDDANTTGSEKYALFSKAATAHVQYVREAVKGNAVDRHLLGLRMLTWEEGSTLHPLFTDPLFSRSNYWQLSTSQLDLKHIVSIGFGPVVPDGYGVCYLISKDYIMVTITAFKDSKVTSSSKMFAGIQESLDDVFALIKTHSTAIEENKKKSTGAKL
jgi:carnitine O-acetyltransferase